LVATATSPAATAGKRIKKKSVLKGSYPPRVFKFGGHKWLKLYNGGKWILCFGFFSFCLSPQPISAFGRADI
jgi:hypothetical protein